MYEFRKIHYNFGTSAWVQTHTSHSEECDASDQGMEVLLLQNDDQAQELPVLYYSIFGGMGSNPTTATSCYEHGVVQ